jgi:ADP-ribose pyrophosphatase
MKPNPWKKLSEEVVFDNPWIRLETHDVINPSGGKSLYGKVHFKAFAIGIIPMDEEGNIWLVGQWRYTLNEYFWEIPMGGGDLNVERLDSAKRELKEETGLSATKWTELLKMHTSNSVTDEVGYAYLAEGLTQGETEFDETEDLEIKKLPFWEAYEMVIDGRITDSLTMTAIFKLAHILKQQQS